MQNRLSSSIERLERRVLLAHFGLDPDFGDGGRLTLPAGGSIRVVAGDKILAISDDGAVRLNPDGTVDPTFTDTGAGPGDERDFESARVSGERLIIVGRVVDSDQVFLRAIDLDTGATDSTFGDGGIVTFTPQPARAGTEFYGHSLTSFIALAEGGVILAITQSLKTISQPLAFSEADVLYKLDSTGQFAPDFGDDGVLIVNDNDDFAALPRLAALPDGRFLMIRTEGFSDRIERRNSDGTLDATFGDGGVTSLPHAGALFPPMYGHPVVQPDGKIVARLEDTQDLDTYGFVTRLNADGTLDTSFGDAGSVRLGAGYPGGLAVDSRGRIIGSTNRSRLFRLTPDGEFDETFDDDGNVFFREPTDIGTLENVAVGFAVDASDRILITRDSELSRLIEQERVVLGLDGRVSVGGTDAADTLTASRAGDVVSVVFNGETFTFPAGDVAGFTIDGDAGALTADIAVDVDVTLISAAGDDSIRTAGGRDWILSGDGNDTIDVGGGDKNLIFGGKGDDRLIAGPGADKIFGEAGADSISGGAGDDWLFGGSPFEAVVEEYNYLDLGDTISGGDGRDRLFGNDRDDFLAGNAGPDILEGGGGADRLGGNGGRDRLYGNSGNDRLFGGAQGDWLYGQGGSNFLSGDGGNDRLYADHGFAGDQPPVDTLYGGAGDDLLVSRDSLADRLFGGRGEDTSVTGEDDDVLAGIESTI